MPHLHTASQEVSRPLYTTILFYPSIENETDYNAQNFTIDYRARFVSTLSIAYIVHAEKWLFVAWHKDDSPTAAQDSLSWGSYPSRQIICELMTVPRYWTHCNEKICVTHADSDTWPLVLYSFLSLDSVIGFAVVRRTMRWNVEAIPVARIETNSNKRVASLCTSDSVYSG